MADLHGEDLAARATDDAGVVAENEDLPAVDGAPAGDHTVAADLLLIHAEVAGAMDGEDVGLVEGTGIEQPLDALAGSQLALAMLRDRRRATTVDGVVAPLAQQVDLPLGDTPRNPGDGGSVGGRHQVGGAHLGAILGTGGRGPPRLLLFHLPRGRSPDARDTAAQGDGLA